MAPWPIPIPALPLELLLFGMLLIRTHGIISDLSLSTESGFNGFGQSSEVTGDSCDTFDCEL